MIPKPHGPRTKNVVWWNGQTNRADRNTLNKHKSGLVWLTGLSAGGKSTIAHGVEKRLFERGVSCQYLYDFGLVYLERQCRQIPANACG